MATSSVKTKHLQGNAFSNKPWHRFVGPAELAAKICGAGPVQVAFRGKRYLPLLYQMSWIRAVQVSYIATNTNGPL